MTPENFIYWIQGFLELQDPKSINEQQVQIIKDHIALALKKETPSYTWPGVTLKAPQWEGIPSCKSDPPLPGNFDPASTIVKFGGSC